MNIYLGIDPGLNGGIVAINENEEIEFTQIMPTILDKKKDYNLRELYEVFDDLDNYAAEKKGQLIVVLEKQYVRPVSGKRSCWMNGFGFGILKMAIASLNLQTEIVNPQKWMKSLSINSKDDKGSVKYCLDKYPGQDWTPTERSKKPHDGLTDAACIALYGKRLICGNNENNNNVVSASTVNSSKR